MWKVGGIKIESAAGRRFFFPKRHENSWKMEIFCKSLCTRKFSMGKFFGASTHGIVTHSGFRKCLWKVGTTNRYLVLRPHLGLVDVLQGTQELEMILWWVVEGHHTTQELMRIGFQGLQLNFLPRDGVGEEEDNWLRLASYQREGATLGRLECVSPIGVAFSWILSWRFWWLLSLFEIISKSSAKGFVMTLELPRAYPCLSFLTLIADIYISISMETFEQREYKSRGEDGNK